MRPLLLTLVWLLASVPAHAELRAGSDSAGLTPAEQHVSQALLDEATAALPPRFIERLDIDVTVRRPPDLPAASLWSADPRMQLELNAALLPALLDGSAQSRIHARMAASAANCWPPCCMN